MPKCDIVIKRGKKLRMFRILLDLTVGEMFLLHEIKFPVLTVNADI